MPQWLDSPEWTNVVKALLHTLWQGTIIAVLLGLAFRRLAHPAARYRCSLAALAGVVIAGLVTWAVLSRPAPAPAGKQITLPAKTTAVVPPQTQGDLLPLVVTFQMAQPRPIETHWTAWLALFWLAGAAMMLARAGMQMAGAERLRRASRPLNDAGIAGLLAEARRSVGLARRVQIVVTDKLTSPAVVGVLVPTLVLPLSLTTALTPEQIRFVLLHELAHIRRGDYLANLFQLFAEALLFFNPAVWWISRQMRIEREACCDRLAVELSGAPADYARTLLCVAENVLSAAPAAAPAFGDKREPSSLADRVKRMLLPGYRPALRLTWRAMCLALLAGGALLFLSALGTRLTVAAILSPQQRIERIEKNMAQFGENPETKNVTGKVKISGHLLMADGVSAPRRVYLMADSFTQNSSTAFTVVARNGFFTNTVAAGKIYLGVDATNFAPAFIGPLDGLSTSDFENLEVPYSSGFDVPLQLLDADTGQPVSGGKVATMYWLGNAHVSIGLSGHSWNVGTNGSVTLTHCADTPLGVTVNAPGYEITQTRFEHLHANESLVVKLQRGTTASGVVLDKATGQPIAGAELRLLYQSGAVDEERFEWDDAMHSLGTSDASGDFTLNQFRRGANYYVGVSAPGHESLILTNVFAGENDLTASLGPELVVRGRVLGDLSSLQQDDGQPALYHSFYEKYGNNSYGNGEWVPVRIESGIARFEFTNRLAGMVNLYAGDREFKRAVDAPVDDWVIDLTRSAATNPPVQKREVIFRFTSKSGVPPRGTVEVTIPDNLDKNHLTAHTQEMEITNGEVRADIPIGGRTEIEPKRTVGYWFSQWSVGSMGSVEVTNGPGPMVVDIPVIPAGAIYASAKNADGTPAGGLFFGVDELKRSPLRDESVPLSDNSDSLSDDAPRKWVSGPLPLGGTYQIYGWRGNSFCVSKSITLTESEPDAEVELQFPPGQSFTGEVRDADGQLLRNTSIGLEFVLPGNHSFSLKSVFTDDNGQFRVDDTTPDAGKYAVNLSAPGCQSENVDVDFSRLPMKLQLKRGLKISGQVVEAGTGNVIPDAEVRAWTMDSQLPAQTTLTDADGRFEFNTLGNATYHLFVSGANFQPDTSDEFAAGRTNLLLKVTPYPGSRLQPKAPPDKTISESSDAATNLSSQTNSFEEKLETDRLFQDGKLLYEMGKLEESQNKLNQALKQDPDNEGARYYLNLVTQALMHAANTNQPPASSSGRQAIISKLEHIHFDYVSWPDGLPLPDVLRYLAQQTKLRDPDKKGINFLWYPGGSNTNDGGEAALDPDKINIKLEMKDVSLGNLLDAIMLVADHPIKYSIEDYGIVFSLKGAGTNSLYTRTFRVDPKIFFANLRRQTQFTGTNVQDEVAALRKVFFDAGVDLQPTNKAFFYNVRLGLIFVRATQQDLNTIETVIEALNQAAPQIHLKARFVEVPTNALADLTMLTNRILTSGQAQSVLQKLKGEPGFKTLAAPEMTIVSGRQAEMRAMPEAEYISTLNPKNQSNAVPTLDILPILFADDYTINLTLVSTLNSSSSHEPLKICDENGSNVVILPALLPKLTQRQFINTVNLWDGQTVMLGGGINSTVQTTKDKVPLLGDLPFFGRLFQSQSKSSIKNNLLIFVTVTIVDPAGNPVHSDDEMRFAQNGIPQQPEQK